MQWKGVPGGLHNWQTAHSFIYSSRALYVFFKPVVDIRWNTVLHAVQFKYAGSSDTVTSSKQLSLPAGIWLRPTAENVGRAQPACARCRNHARLKLCGTCSTLHFADTFCEFWVQRWWFSTFHVQDNAAMRKVWVAGIELAPSDFLDVAGSSFTAGTFLIATLILLASQGICRNIYIPVLTAPYFTNLVFHVCHPLCSGWKQCHSVSKDWISPHRARSWTLPVMK